ncbi:MAG: 3-beta hydroxysteroid dehydrogenase [Euryarchaeota archaeon]|nr:3-beta hydroxysteroid dehydrogenase [Euryarchaeota archaeon]|tara:strand:+ start:2003 stop:3016 length:1014 start_codon:yes stop_codon:yes gene_type:complete
MKIIVAGGCGFVGSNLSIFLKKYGHDVISVDNLQRKGSILNLKRIKSNRIKNYKIDLSNSKKINLLPKTQLIIDCCAEPSVEASRIKFDSVFNSNLISTKNLLIKCVNDDAKIIFISTSRVFSIKALNNLKKNINKKVKKKIDMNFDISSPKSLYGYTKLASEDLIKEFSYNYNIKYIINRFGVISGPWQFGKVDQGFMSLFMWKFLNKKKLKFIGYGGSGKQERDVIHIDDFCKLINLQINSLKKIYNKSFTVGGGASNTVSLNDVYKICHKLTNFKPKIIRIKKTSIYDIPYYKTCNKEVYKTYKWKVSKNVKEILYDIFLWQKKNYKKLKKYIK